MYRQLPSSYLLTFRRCTLAPHVALSSPDATRPQLTDTTAGCAQACLNIKDDYAIAHNNLALLHAARGSLDDAVFSLNKALQLDPGLDCKLPGLRRNELELHTAWCSRVCVTPRNYEGRHVTTGCQPVAARCSDADERGSVTLLLRVAGAKSNLIKVKELQRRAQLAGEADTPQ